MGPEFRSAYNPKQERSTLARLGGKHTFNLRFGALGFWSESCKSVDVSNLKIRCANGLLSRWAAVCHAACEQDNVAKHAVNVQHAVYRSFFCNWRFLKKFQERKPA